MFVVFTFNIYVDLVPFLLTDLVKKTFKAGIEFNEEFKPEYEDLENPTSIDFVNKVKDAVSAILTLTQHNVLVTCNVCIKDGLYKLV